MKPWCRYLARASHSHADCPYEGEWLHENKLFLYRSDQPMEVEFTAGFHRGDGEWCLGFNAVTLASLLGFGSKEVFEHNRNRTLILDDVRSVPPQRKGAVAKGTFSAWATGLPVWLSKRVQRVQPDCQRIRTALPLFIQRRHSSTSSSDIVLLPFVWSFWVFSLRGPRRTGISKLEKQS